MIDLTGRLVAITGGYGEIAESIASRLLGRGARVVLLGRDPKKGEARATQLRVSTGGDVRFLAVDVSDSKQVAAVAERITGEAGPIDGLVVNAATAILGNAFDHTDDQWRSTMSVNLDGAFYCCRAFGATLRERGGSIVIVSSIAARIDTTPAKHIAYGVSKAALTRLAELLATEWAQYRIRVNSVEPGHVETRKTPFIRKKAPQMVEKWAADAPIGRLIQPADVAAMVAFLLSDDASAITGAAIPIDGGYAKTKS